MLQRTLAKSISVTGVGLHSGERVALTLHPAPETAGFPSAVPIWTGEMGETIKLYALPHQRYAPVVHHRNRQRRARRHDRTHHVRAVRLRHRQCAD